MLLITVITTLVREEIEMTSALRKKYRPSLTGAQIDHILELAKADFSSSANLAGQSYAVIAVLAPFKAKIDNSGIAEAYSINPPKPSIEESLGMIPAINLKSTKEELWALAYAKYSLSPATCTLAEIEAAHEHMYLNDLMTPEQLAKFEAGNTEEILLAPLEEAPLDEGDISDE